MRAHRKLLKPIVGLDNAFDGTMVQLDDVVQVLVLPDLDWR